MQGPFQVRVESNWNDVSGITALSRSSNGFDWMVVACDDGPGRTSEGLLMARTKRKSTETKQWMGHGGSTHLHALFDNGSLSGCI